MTHPLFNPFTLHSLHLLALGRAFLRYRNPRRRQAGMLQDEFHERTWREAAAKLGATYEPLRDGIAQITLDGTATRVMGNVSAIDDPVTLAVLHDKPLTHRILKARGLPVPRHAIFSLGNMASAVEFLRQSRTNCVIKPAGGTGGGRGVATGVRTRWQLARAAAAAAVYADELLIEEQVEGENYRLLYLDGQLIDAIAKKHPIVTGDGHTSVAGLVRRANERRLREGSGVALLSVDLDMRRTLASQGLSLRSVPPAGVSVRLKTVINENAAADNSTATHLLCDSIVKDGEKAVRALGARFAGIDIVTPDPARPLAEAGGVILEVNGTPNLYYHYHKSDGAFAVATHLLRRLLLEQEQAHAERIADDLASALDGLRARPGALANAVAQPLQRA